jgi:type 2A phosphatase activator TIP41
MTFGNNSLVLTYDPSPSSTNASSLPVTDGGGSEARRQEEIVQIKFETLEALAGVATGEGWEERVGGGVKVAMAEQWGKNRSVCVHMLPCHTKGACSRIHHEEENER